MPRFSLQLLVSILGLLLLFSTSSAINVSPATGFTSTDGSVDFSLNIPQNETNADVYFTIAGPSSSSWIAVGMGNDKMAGSLIFMVYRNTTGGVTLSPRYATGNSEPSFEPTVQVDMLPGSGIINSNYVAFALCHNCRNWANANTSLDVTNTAGKFIFAAGPDGDLNSNSPSQAIRRHDSYGAFTMNIQLAQGIRGPPNPATVDGTGTVQTMDKSDSSSPDAAHAVLMIFSFVGLMPIGLIILRLLNRPAWHGINQTISVAVALLGTAIGIYISTMYNRSKHFNSAHQIFGLLIIIAMIGQFILGFMHHRIYTKTMTSTKLTPIHIWLGRVVIPAGIANGFLGFPLALNSKYNWALLALVLLVAIVMGPFAFWAWKRNHQKKDSGNLANQPIGGYQSQPWTVEASRSEIQLGHYQTGGTDTPPQYPGYNQESVQARSFA